MIRFLERLCGIAKTWYQDVLRYDRTQTNDRAVANISQSLIADWAIEHRRRYCNCLR